MSLVDGKAIAARIYEELAKKITVMPTPPRLAIITCAPNFETTKYLDLKRKKADQVGIRHTIIELPETTTTNEFVRCVETIAPTVGGVVVQLPLPAHIDREVVLAAVPASKDPDALNGGAVLSPVVGAIDEIVKIHDVDFTGKRVAVIGNGRLVGAPAAHYATDKGATVSILTEHSTDFREVIQAADILISGVGQPGLIQPEMVKEDVIVFDAGTSEDGGQLRGDVDIRVAEKALLFTPVPGGIGPITIAVLLGNLATLCRRSK